MDESEDARNQQSPPSSGGEPIDQVKPIAVATPVETPSSSSLEDSALSTEKTSDAPENPGMASTTTIKVETEAPAPETTPEPSPTPVESTPLPAPEPVQSPPVATPPATAAPTPPSPDQSHAPEHPPTNPATPSGVKTTNVSKSPKLLVIAVLALAFILAAIAVFVFMKTGDKTKASKKSDVAVNNETTVTITASEVKTIDSNIDKSMATVDEAADFSTSDLSDTTLGL